MCLRKVIDTLSAGLATSSPVSGQAESLNQSPSKEPITQEDIPPFIQQAISKKKDLWTGGQVIQRGMYRSLINTRE